MKCHLIAVGRRMPEWVVTGYERYARRLSGQPKLVLHELAPVRRSAREPSARVMQSEGERLLAAVPAGARIIALDEHGAGWSTRDLAGQMQGWLASGTDVALLVGGADGLSPECLQAAAARWSLSPLTLPHGLVRVVVAEQLYRAWSMLHNHPYHRD